MNDATVKTRVLSREQARACAALVVEEAGRVPTEAQGVFWDEIRKILPLPMRSEIKKPVEPFTDRQAQAFGASKMPFGKHEGLRIDEVPLDYLERLCDPSQFTVSLKRYLSSERIKRERETTGLAAEA